MQRGYEFLELDPGARVPLHWLEAQQDGFSGVEDGIERAGAERHASRLRTRRTRRGFGTSQTPGVEAAAGTPFQDEAGVSACQSVLASAGPFSFGLLHHPGDGRLPSFGMLGAWLLVLSVGAMRVTKPRVLEDISTGGIAGALREQGTDAELDRSRAQNRNIR
jgi:hypothetical protein